MTAADICRERGWEKGTLLLSDYRHYQGIGWTQEYYRLTAVGETQCLAVLLGSANESDPEPRCDIRKECIVEIRDHVLTHKGVEWGTRWTAIDRLPWEVPDATK